MSDKAIPGICPNCGKEMLIIATQIRDNTDWQIKYGIDCENCGYRFNVDKESLDNLLRLSKNARAQSIMRMKNATSEIFKRSYYSVFIFACLQTVQFLQAHYELNQSRLFSLIIPSIKFILGTLFM